MTEALVRQGPAAIIQPKILCVDDEPNILSSLRRLFRMQGYQVLTAESGHAGLKMLEEEAVDLVISDMRMPEMNGASFLEQVRARWPDTLRLLLTGHADVQSIVDAVNRGEIYRYITKPWDDNDIHLIVRHALERKTLEQERRRLEALTQWQNEELKALNANLEEKVEARTAALKKARDELMASNAKLKANFTTSIKVFSNLIELRGGKLPGHSRRVADLARRIAEKMGLDAHEIQEIFIAALLHNIGKIGFSDELLAMPVSLMKSEALGEYRKYPVHGEQLLIPLEDLNGPAKIVRSHQERFDGKGFPDSMSGFDIPLGSRIVALASDYDNLQIGTFSQRSLRSDEAASMMSSNRGKRYDPMVVDAFEEIIIGAGSASAANCAQSSSMREEVITTAGLRAGMIISRDLISRDGYLLLSADHMLSERLIQQITNFEKSSGTSLTIYVRGEKEKT